MLQSIWLSIQRRDNTFHVHGSPCRMVIVFPPRKTLFGATRREVLRHVLRLGRPLTCFYVIALPNMDLDHNVRNLLQGPHRCQTLERRIVKQNRSLGAGFGSYRYSVNWNGSQVSIIWAHAADISSESTSTM